MSLYPASLSDPKSNHFRYGYQHVMQKEPSVISWRLPKRIEASWISAVYQK